MDFEKMEYDDGFVVDRLASVVANGTKTYAQILNELFAAVPFEKCQNYKYSLALEIDNMIYYCQRATTGTLRFSACQVTENGYFQIFWANLKSSNSQFLVFQGNTSGTTYTDRSSIAPASGISFSINYMHAK